MRLSSKCRYAIAATVCIAGEQEHNEYISLSNISEKLGISKIYLEQVFSLLRLNGIVSSIKGSQGGYQLARTSSQITVYDVLSAVDTSLFETTEETTMEKAPELEMAMNEAVYSSLDSAIKMTLQKITLSDILTATEKHKTIQGFMFFI